MAERRTVGLRRNVGLGLLISVLSVNLAAAVFVSLGIVANEALDATPGVFVVAGLVFLLTMVGYIEGTVMLPQAGGAAGFARRGLGELWSFFAGWALLLDYLILVVLASYFAVHYLGSIVGLDALLQSPVDTIATAVLVVAVSFASLVKIRTNTRIAILVSILSLVTQLALAGLGFALVFDPDLAFASLDVGTTPDWDSILFALPIAMIGFTGLETVASLGEEVETPARDIPRPMIISAVVSVLVFVTMSMVALSALPVRGSGASAHTALGADDGWIDRPLVGLADALGFSPDGETLIRMIVGLLAAAVLFLAASTAVTGMARVAYAMSRYRQAPSLLFRLDRSGSPRIAVAVLTVVALGLLLVTVSLAESAVVLAQVYAFGATLTTTIAGVAIVRLRWTEPELIRPWRAPWSIRIRGRSFPVTIAAGAALSGAMWVLVLATHDAARVVGIGWMVFGFVVYATYRVTHGLPIRSLAVQREDTAPEFDARSYRRIVVAVRPERGMLYGAGDAELVGLAHKLLDTDDPRPAHVSVMLVHELPLIDPLDADIGDLEGQTTRRLAKIREAAGTLDLRIASTVARARAAGRAICMEAARRDADAVLLATRSHRRQGDVPFGRCVAYVLRHAPCDVVVLSIPEQTLRQVVSSSKESRARLADAGKRE